MKNLLSHQKLIPLLFILLSYLALTGCYQVGGYSFDMCDHIVWDNSSFPPGRQEYYCPSWTLFDEMYALESTHEKDGETVTYTTTTIDVGYIETYAGIGYGGECWAEGDEREYLWELLRFKASHIDVKNKDEKTKYPYAGIMVGTHRLEPEPEPPDTQALGVTLPSIPEAPYDRMAVATEAIDQDYHLPDRMKVLVASHEMGHAFGILQECENEGCIMCAVHPLKIYCTPEEAEAMIPTDFCDDCKAIIDEDTDPTKQ